MKAMVVTRYKEPGMLQLQEVEKPVPADNQVLVRVCAAALNGMDWHFLHAPLLMRMFMLGFPKPKGRILGADIAGRVEAVGKDVTRFRPGDEAFGMCGQGGFAEYVAVSERGLAPKPANLSFEEAAAVPVAAVTALQALRYAAEIRPGEKVLINGASGGVGTFAVQLAKAFGAEVTAVCSTRNLEVARSIGADHVVDYTQEDFTRNGQQYDLILAVNGYHSLSDYKHALRPQGAYVVVGGSYTQMFSVFLLGRLMSEKGGRKMSSMGVARGNQKDLLFLAELLEAGKIKPVVDRCYPLSELGKATRYHAQEHARGKIIITVTPGGN